jgi:hypothetical protein
MSRVALVQQAMARSLAIADQSDVRLFIDPPLIEVIYP